MKVIRWLDRHFEEVLMGVLLVAITLVMFIQVFLRFVIGHALSFPEELARYLFIWLSFLGISYSVRCRNSLKVDVLEIAIPKLKPILNMIGNLCFLGFCIFMTKEGFIAVKQIFIYKQTSAAMNLPMWIVYGAFFVGCILSVIRLIQVIYEDITHKGPIEKGERERLEEEGHAAMEEGGAGS